MRQGLYWKILIGLFLGLAFGTIFPTNYKITDTTLAHIEKNKAPEDLLFILQNQKKDFAQTETEFLKRLKPPLGPEFYEKYKNEILAESRFNPYLSYVSWFGELFMRALKMIILPLVLVTVISGMSNLTEDDNLLRLSIKTILYFVVTSSLAIFTGITCANILEPGVGMDISNIPSVQGLSEEISFKDSILNIIPVNLFESLSKGNMLSIIFFSILFGFFITKVHDRSRILLINFFNAFHDVLLKLTNFIFRIIPLAIFALMASFAANFSGDSQKIFSIVDNLGAFIFTVLIGLLFHAVISLPLIMRIGFKLNPWKHFKVLRSTLLTVFSTSSPIVTLPLTMSSIQKGCGVSKKVTSLVLPLGTTISLDGTALYVSVAAIFIAQAYGIQFSLLDQFIVLTISLLVSFASTGVPLSSFSTVAIILSAVGLPLEGIGLILTVDLILEMLRNTVSVWNHSCCAVIIAKSEGEALKV